jgi:hypothetical protein
VPVLRVLRRVSGHTSNEATWGWRKLRNENSIICTLHQMWRNMIKSRRMRWARHVARKGR